MKIGKYFKFALDFFILRKNHPYILGLVITDRCNLSCRHCRVANIRRQNMSYQDIEDHLNNFYKRGVRFLYLEGGEPYLWREGNRRLEDIVLLARDIGYMRIHVYTNGTIPLTSSADFTWVSIDGLADTYQNIRGTSLSTVFNNIRNTRKRFAIIFTINSLNYKEIVPFLEFISTTLPWCKVMFFFHTPYYGFDYLFLTKEAKDEAIKMLLHAKKRRLPVLNSVSGLKVISLGEYEHPTNLWWVVDQTGEYQCCRAYGNNEVCQHCGYSSCAELVLIKKFNMGAIREMVKVF